MRPSTFWKTYIKNPALFFISFSPSHLEGHDDNNDPRAHICAWGGEFCQVSIFAKSVCQTVGGQFFCFAKIIWMSSPFAKLLELLWYDSMFACWCSFSASSNTFRDAHHQNSKVDSNSLFVWLISHQPAVLFSQNKSATNKQPAVLFSHNKSAPAISHQPNEQAVNSDAPTVYVTLCKKQE
jgi:hypothetical protein